jgi:pimeloyl-ACP methyl ester carboxylesterase
VDAPSTRYVDRRGKSLAYQVMGGGPRAVIAVLEVSAHLDLLWTDPVWVEQSRRIGQHARLVLFQQLGFGLSDRLDRIPTLEEQTSDIEAVMDAEGIERATLFGLFNGSMPVVLFAARCPERVDGIVLWGPVPQGWHHEGFASTAGLTAAEAAMIDTAWEDGFDHWGEGRTFAVWNPVIAGPTTRASRAATCGVSSPSSAPPRECCTTPSTRCPPARPA